MSRVISFCIGVFLVFGGSANAAPQIAFACGDVLTCRLVETVDAMLGDAARQGVGARRLEQFAQTWSTRFASCDRAGDRTRCAADQTQAATLAFATEIDPDIANRRLGELSAWITAVKRGTRGDEQPAQGAAMLAAVTRLQTALAALGFDPGLIDGQLGAHTRTAVDRAFQTISIPGYSPDLSTARGVTELADHLETMEGDEGG